jgi:hypothetical protein
MLGKIQALHIQLLQYLKVKVELSKLESQEKIEDTIVALAYGTIILVLLSQIAFLLLVILASFINQWLDSKFAGFLIVFFILSAVLTLCIFKKGMVFRLIRKSIHLAFYQLKQAK